MKKLLFTLSVVLITSLYSKAQDNHLSLIYDFEGADFEHSAKAMVGTNDSIYIVSNTPNGHGIFFRIDGNGEGYNVIWEFDNVRYAPSNLVANDTIIYGTTRFSEKGGGAIFKYSLQDYSFEFIADFDPFDVMETHIKYITDSVLWLNSDGSFADKGSIFTLKKDGTELTKIYNNTNLELGQNPTDFAFHNDSIYIAFVNGGGIPYPDGTGGNIMSGCFARIKYDGTGYQKIVVGQDGIGTSPKSLIIRENKLIGVFSTSGNNPGGNVFTCNFDGSSYEPLCGLKDRVEANMLSTDTLIYGISSSEIFGINPSDGEYRIFDDITANPDFGFDVCANPAYLNGYTYIATQQGGPNSGGTILKWTNQAPIANEIKSENIKSSMEIDLKKLFTDPEGDSLTYHYEYNSNEISLVEKDGILTLTATQSGDAKVNVTAKDGWNGNKSVSLTVSSSTTSVDDFKESQNAPILYPNPTSDILRIGSKDVECIEILSLDGTCIKLFKAPSDEINISFLNSGVYLCRYQINGHYYSQKIVKQ